MARRPRAPPPRVLTDGMPELPYRSGLRYRPTPRHGEHRGQRKLLIAETRFLVDHPTQLVIYAGAAPSTHTPTLLKMFPTLHVWLIDPANFDRTIVRMCQTGRVRIFKEYFTPVLALQLAREASELGLTFAFVSDLRTSPDDADVAADLRLQRECLCAMRPPPAAAMLKFRLPYGVTDLEYLDGEVQLQAWGPVATTETRLVVTPTETDGILGYTATRRYVLKTYESQMYYINQIMRCYGHFDVSGVIDARGVDDCYDCALEMLVLQQFCQKHAVPYVPTPRALMDMITHDLRKPLHGGHHR